MNNNITLKELKTYCNICDKHYNKFYNLKRHMLTIHGYTFEEYINGIHQNNQPDSNNIQQNSINIEIDTQHISNKQHICNKCSKNFARNWNLQKHMKICKGIVDKYSCMYCHKKFKHDNSRFSHYKICKAKKEQEELIIKKEQYKIIDDNDCGIVYLIQPVELLGTNRYKLGCSSKYTIERLQTGYRKGYKCENIKKCYKPFEIEKQLKNIFENKFILIGGTEIFEGDIYEMNKIFDEIVKYY
jgi:hypothetical protein